MKPLILALQIGQKIWATVEELLGNSDLIVNFDGELLRVINHSKRSFRAGQRIQLHVASKVPLEFRLVEPRRLVRPGIDIEA